MVSGAPIVLPRVIALWILLWRAMVPAMAEDVPAVATPPSVDQARLVDRVVAVVDDDPIFQSDIDRAIGIRGEEPADGESMLDLERRVLESLIDRRLRLHAVERHVFGLPPAHRIQQQMDQFAERFTGPEAFEEHLRGLGLSQEGLRQLVIRQLRILAYIEERLRPRVFVDRETIRKYYDEELVPAVRADGAEPPAMESVEGEIRFILEERRLDEEIDTWSQDLRASAVIVDHFDRPRRPLPAVVDRLER